MDGINGSDHIQQRQRHWPDGIKASGSDPSICGARQPPRGSVNMTTLLVHLKGVYSDGFRMAAMTELRQGTAALLASHNSESTA